SKFYFFFQAEDGIRCFHVTGVQTCALPIYKNLNHPRYPKQDVFMSLAEKLCLSAAALFFITGLLTGVWKYACMARSPRAAAPRYVDIAHRSSLMYSFAAMLLGWFAGYSVYPRSEERRVGKGRSSVG